MLYLALTCSFLEAVKSPEVHEGLAPKMDKIGKCKANAGGGGEEGQGGMGTAGID